LGQQKKAKTLINYHCKLFFLTFVPQTLYRTHQKPTDSAHRLTPTLIALIVLFTLLVTPSQLLVFVALAGFGDVASFRSFRTAAVIVNFLLLTNFAVNFVLYLAVNAEFRRVASDLLRCRCRRKGSSSGYGRRSPVGGQCTSGIALMQGSSPSKGHRGI
jgi:hypothetical protein